MAMRSKMIEVIRPFGDNPEPRVSVVIPSRGNRQAEERLDILLTALQNQVLKRMEIIVVRGVAPQGRAINMGVDQASGTVLVIMDDDSMPGDENLTNNLVNAIESDEQIGMAGASLRTPSSANRFQRRASKQFPRFNVALVDAITDSDLACHGCCAFPRDVFLSVGKEREEIIRGLDPDLRQRIRDAGYRVVLVPDCVVFHPLPPTFLKFLKTFFRNGMGSAFAQRFYPEFVFETDENLSAEGFTAKRSFLYRLVRFPVRLIRDLASWKLLRFTAYMSYSWGFIMGYLYYSIRGSAIGVRQ